MGLDGVELVMRIEESFGVDLPDTELGTVVTVGDLYALVLSKLDGSYACLSSRAFYRIRKAMVTNLQVSRRSVRPATLLEPLMAPSARRSLWKRMEQQTELRFPQLEHPNYFDRLTFLLVAALYALTCLLLAPTFFANFPAPMPGLLAISLPFAVGVVLIPIGMALVRASTPFLATRLPVQTAGDLARSVLSLNYPQLKDGALKASQQDNREVWRILRKRIAEQLQIEENRVVPDTHIVDDLGCD